MNEKNIKVLIVEADSRRSDLVEDLLKSVKDAAFNTETCDTLAKALELLQRRGIGLILLDPNLPDSIGLDALARIRVHAPNVPVIVITETTDKIDTVEAFRNGAQDYLVMGRMNSEILSCAIRYAVERNKVVLRLRETEVKSPRDGNNACGINRELAEYNKKLNRLACRDPQTGLFNHGYMEKVIEAEFYRAKRYHHPLSIIMTDVDYFKSINEAYGYKFGDIVLRQLAHQIRKLVRKYDVVVRYGGEEFMVISPDTDRGQALVLARRIFDAVSLHNFEHKNRVIKLKISIAAASYPEDKANNAMGLVKIAEQLLAKAKDAGGNRVYDSTYKKSPKGNKPYRIEDVDLLKRRLDALNKEVNQSLVESIFAFAKTIELKDRYTGEHVENTVRYATEIARALGLGAVEVEMIRQAAMLHDLGKLGISESILTKKAKLTKRELDEIRKHPRIAADILRPIHVLNGIIPYILYHHERWDGKGYPEGLKAEEIPLGARIVAVADVYHALISYRSYRKAFPRAVALKMMKDAAGTQFDPRIVDTLVDILNKKRRK